MKRLFLASTLALAGACASSETPAPEAAAPGTARVEPITCGSIARIHRFGGILLAGQPQPADFAVAKELGVHTVINLRHASENSAFDERAVVEGLGLEYENPAWDGAAELTDEVFDSAREYFARAEQPVLVHCGSANRVGAVWLPWRVLDGGLGVDAALAEAKAIGLKSAEYEAKAREYVARRSAPAKNR